ncbi:MAG: glycosyltransferase [Gottschalkiaceae bacterium]|nr:MAG: glycosyltransferase [Gottschalkiaceae bacterium]
MKISVVIPCYNCEEYISKTIRSLLEQTISPLEIILINDASTDKTLDILREIEKERYDIVRIINLDNNKGASYARNHGVQISKGDYILFMDSDDIAESELMEKILFRLEDLNNKGKSKYILCYSAYLQIDQNDIVIDGISRGIQVEPEETLGYEFVRNYIMSTSGVLVNKECFIKLGGFNENIVYSEDWDLWLRIARIGGFAYVDEPLVRLRRHGKNMSSNISRMLEAEKNILKQYNTEYIKNAIFKRKLNIEVNAVDYVSILFRLEKWEDGFLELKELLEKGYDFYNLYFYLGLYYLKNKNFKKALEYFNKTINIKNDHGAALNNVGALSLLYSDKKTAKKYLDLAISYFPSYMDANNNYKLLDKEIISLEKLKFTWRELRKVLTNYNG